MATLPKKVTKLMIDSFEGATAFLQPGESNRRTVHGFVVWEGFDELPMSERVRRVWSVLEKHLKAAEMKRVSIIMPFTPAEWTVYHEDAAREENELQRTARTSVA
jgi:acid stress-induced BolA-like protein IbaG/YrbA